MYNKTIDFMRKRSKSYSLMWFSGFLMYFLISLFFIKNSLIGIDFSVYYSASKMVTEGATELIYNINSHHKVLESVLGQEIPYMLGWFYPPIFLLIVIPFVLLPYKYALFLWVTVTFLIYLFAIKKISLSKNAIYIAMGYPGVWMNLHWGQNAFLTTTLFGLGIYFSKKKPMISGIMFSLLCYKPHFALIAFIVLLLSKNWKTLIWSVIFVLLLIAFSAGLFGIDTWLIYIKSQLASPNILLGDVWQDTAGMQPSLYSFFRLIGFNSKITLLIQGVIGICMLSLTIFTWNNVKSIEIKGIILLSTTLLSTPYLGQYDLVILVLPLMWYLNDCKINGWLKGDIWVLILLWLTPLINWPILYFTRIQIVPLSVILLVIFTCRRIYHYRYIKSKISTNK